METHALAKLLLLFMHVLAFALAVGCVLREDAKLIFSPRHDVGALRSSARLVIYALIVLWASGTALLVLETDAALHRLVDNPKLLAKLTVVCVLTLNGIALHFAAFPCLLGERRPSRRSSNLAAVLGAVSASSWLAATLLGIARTAASGLTYFQFMAAYAGLLTGAIAFAWLVVRPRLSAKLRA
jgi:hypothetical protein